MEYFNRPLKILIAYRNINFLEDPTISILYILNH